MIFSKPLYYVTKVKNHRVNKERLLSKISERQKSYRTFDAKLPDGKDHPYSHISNTDYDLVESGIPRDWFTISLSEKDRSNYIKFLCREFNVNESQVKLDRMWFNQYLPNSGSDHPFHIHAGGPISAQFTNIYYLELKDKSLRTILKHPTTGKEIVPNVGEGQILTFNANIEHRSPRNWTDTRKTVISFNTRFL